MGPKYHKVYHRIWANSAFRQHSEDARFAALYLLTCPHRNTEGLFRLPLPLASYELGWSEDRAVDALDELQAAGFIRWDRAADVVWLVNAVAWDAPVGPKQIKGAVNRLAETPDTPLRSEYLVRCAESCPDLAAQLSDQLGWQPIHAHPKGYPKGSDTPSIAHSHSHSHSQAQAHAQPRPRPEPAADPASDDPQPSEAEAAVVVDGLLTQLGHFDATARPDEIRYVARAMSRGWSVLALQDCAAEAAVADVSDVRQYLLGMLRKRANEDGPDASDNQMKDFSGDVTWQTAWNEALNVLRGQWQGVTFADLDLPERTRRALADARRAAGSGATETDNRIAFAAAWQRLDGVTT